MKTTRTKLLLMSILFAAAFSAAAQTTPDVNTFLLNIGTHICTAKIQNNAGSCTAEDQKANIKLESDGSFLAEIAGKTYAGKFTIVGTKTAVVESWSGFKQDNTLTKALHEEMLWLAHHEKFDVGETENVRVYVTPDGSQAVSKIAGTLDLKALTLSVLKGKLQIELRGYNGCVIFDSVKGRLSMRIINKEGGDYTFFVDADGTVEPV